MNDWKLIREYVDKGSEHAFADLTNQHMSLVYWTCHRDLNNAQLAEDATQVVFILLAKKARSFNRHVSVSSWLFNTSRFVCRNYRKSAARQRRLEEEAVRDMELRQSEAWTEVEPLLNDALSALSTADREAIIMRFVEGLSYGEVAIEIGISEDTARKRVTRAVDKLRSFFLKKDVAVTSIVIAALLTEHGVQAVPTTAVVAIQSTVAHLSASSPAAAFHNAALLKKGMTIAMHMTMRKVVVVSAALILTSTVATISVKEWEGRHSPTPAVSAANLVTDQAEKTAMPGDVQAQAARQGVLTALTSTAEGMRDGNPDWVTNLTSPDAQIVTSKGTALTQSGFYQSEASFYKSTKNRQPHFTLIDCRVDGDHATAQVEAHMDAVSSFPGSAANAEFVADGTWSLEMENHNGAWIIDKGHQLSSTQTLNGGHM